MKRYRSVRWLAAFCLLLSLASEALAAKRPEVVSCQLGLGGRYKLGCWAPVRLDVAGGEQPLGVGVLAIAPDSDGVGVATTIAGARPLSTEPGRISRASFYTRVGRNGAPLTAQLVAGGRVVSKRSFPAGYDYLDRPGEMISEPVQSTQRLYLQLSGPSGDERAEMLRDLESITGGSETYAAFVHSRDELPKEAIGYDSFDAVLLMAGADAATSWLADVSADDRRIEALTEWVRSGGRLVVSCGASGDALLGKGGPLAGLCPGEFARTDSLASAAAIEAFADSPDATKLIDLAAAPLRISRIRDARGVVEAFGGRDRTETPLVVRSPLGFGEVTFVAFDLDAPAIAGWQGRSTLLKRLLRHRSPPNNDYYWHSFQEEFVYRLSELLDESFSGVRTAPFLLVVGLVLGYLMLIGPGDYFFVKNVLKRVEATWVTFPLIVILTSAAAYAGAYWLKGDKLRISRVEVVDLDAATGVSRGSVFTHLFSPRSARYDVSLVTESLAGEPLDPTQSWTAWLGKPGWGMGGMVGSAGGALSPDYHLDATPASRSSNAHAEVLGLPIQVWSTKTLLSRYLARVDRSFDSQLAPDGEGLVVGSLTNDTGAKLTDCWLLYGAWAWRLGDLADGETKSVDPSVTPVKITTMMRDDSDLKTFRGVVDAVTLTRRKEDLNETTLYLSDLDLSHRLDAGDALLIATAAGESRSRLVRPDGAPLVDSENADTPVDKSWVFVRVALPVGAEE